MTPHIRKGVAADAFDAISVLCTSISKLCLSDHLNDEQELSAWLQNKNEASWLLWISNKNATVLVAEMMSEVVGVGMVNADGEVLLNYVSPNMRFQGISKALLGNLEKEASGFGAAFCFLESTKTAHQFYERSGYKSINSNGLNMQKYL